MPQPLSQEQHGYRQRWVEWFALQGVDWDAHIEEIEFACWYVARHGRQDFDKIRSWTLDELARAGRHLTKLIELETPKPSGGGA